MAQAGYTPIQLYYSTTASAAPSSGNLANGELAINITDGKLYYKDNGGTVRVLAGTGGTGVVAGSNTQVQFNNNGVFGASSGLTFDGTTLTANALTVTNATTLSAGTANGVAYLNGSKVLTTGSALTFDGSILGVSKSDTTNPSLLTVTNTSTTGSFAAAQMALKSYNGTSVVEGLVLSSISNSWSYGNTLANSAQVYTGLANGLALVAESSTGPIRFLLGSTASEQMRLTSTGLGIGTSSPSAPLTVQGNASAYGINIIGRSAGQNEAWLYWYKNGGSILNAGILGDNQGLKFAVDSSATERMRLDSSGNLGLGVTPSTYNVGRAVEVGAVGNAFWTTSNDVYLTANTFYQSGYKYAASNFASMYEQTSGSHRWFTAPSGTAGNAISFTQAMTLDASGNLGVGTTSPQAYSGYAVITADSSTNGGVFSVRKAGVVYGNLSATANALTIDGVGSGGTIVFRTGAADTERARIDSSGNLLVGTTSFAYQPTQGATIAGGTVGAIGIGHASGTADGNGFLNFAYNGTNIGSVVQSSTSSVLYNTSSDYRLKNVIGPVTDSGTRIDALEPIEYEWKLNGSRTRGFLAHKFQEVYAGSVTGAKDAVDAEGKPVYQAMQAGSSEVIADLVAEIQSLRKRLAAAGIA